MITGRSICRATAILENVTGGNESQIRQIIKSHPLENILIANGYSSNVFIAVGLDDLQYLSLLSVIRGVIVVGNVVVAKVDLHVDFCLFNGFKLMIDMGRRA